LIFSTKFVGGGVDLTVIFERHSASDRDEKWKSKDAVLYKEIYLNGIKIKGERSASVEAIRYIRALEYDLFVVHGYSTVTAMIAIEYMRLHKIPFVISADGGLLSKERKIKAIIKHHFISPAQAWLSTGATTSEYFAKYGAKANMIFEYPFSSLKNLEIEQPAREEEKNRLKNDLGITDKKVVLYVGQFIHRKGIDVLLDIARRLESLDTGLYLVGGEPDDELKTTVKEYGLGRVHFIPFKGKDELRSYYRVADVFTLPTREDIWGLVVNEAMGKGVPVVSTNRCVAALTMVTPGKNGYIVDVEDSDQLFEKIADLLNNPSKRSDFAQKAYETATKYTIEEMAKRHIIIFDQIINQSSQQ
jgi:glycosyltransferase involved in cell wall biosynthesis